MNSLDNYFGINQDALRIRSARAQLIAENIANADTPKYQARDIDFASALKAARSISAPASLRVTDAAHIPADASMGFAFEIAYRTPLGAALDNNTVDSDFEKGEFMRNAIQYQTSLKFLDGKIRNLITAIRGE